MKKLLAYLLVCVLALSSLSAALADETLQIKYDYDELRVAVITPLAGDFFTSLWGNGSSDLDVRYLIHGYNLIEWDTEQGMFVPDESVVSGVTVKAEADGGYTFLIALYNDLFYSDGTPVTAWDYAFSLLLTMAPEMKELGANVRRPEYIAGYNDYITGKKKSLSGVRVPADRLLSITIDGRYFPFFYELGLLDCVPYPISVIAPGVKVADDGNGVYLTNADARNNTPVFTADLLRETILDEAAGYRTHPSVTTGAYLLTSYEDGEARFEINSKYKGNSKGAKPLIQRIRMLSMTPEEMIQACREGTVTLLNKISDKKTIADCLSLPAGESVLTSEKYGRTGMSFISFNTEHAPLEDPAVRRAIAYLADRDEIAKESVGDYGMRAQGYFGEGQWMYLLLSGTVSPAEVPAENANAQTKTAYEQAAKAWEALSLDVIEAYDRNTEKGIGLLENAGWNLNERGEAFDTATDKVRCKKTDEGLLPLRFTLAYAQGSIVGQALEGSLAQPLAEAGIELDIQAIPGNELLRQYYRLDDPEYDMFFLGTNFDVLYDPSLSFIETEDGHHVWKTSGLEDDELWELAVSMRRTQPDDKLGYCTKWLEFQKRFMEQLPLLPVYTNTYFDFYPPVLHEYHIADCISWPQAVIGAYLSDCIPEETETVQQP